MDTIKTLDQLLDIKNKYLSEYKKFKHNVLVCGGGGCVSSNCKEVDDAIREEINAFGINYQINVIQTGCMGICAVGPVVLILPERIFYTQLTPKKAKDIVKRIKGSKIKVMAKINGDELRISGRDKDDLQACIAFLKQEDIPVDLQFVNYR